MFSSTDNLSTVGRGTLWLGGGKTMHKQELTGNLLVLVHTLHISQCGESPYHSAGCADLMMEYRGFNIDSHSVHLLTKFDTLGYTFIQNGVVSFSTA